ncbi:hypothetical protein KFK09_028060 [Dendrobium nobile]|uniref:Reverse transcriptase domain-containing protein n=1 Tax=Dendrobium nobile TaxID=94219 RepID=A0A8T3A6D9_DENNO|nr:hypothetical protein KFK09_028060 [Dendrobium nobile]
MFIAWIKACTSDVYFSVCINGSLEGFFNSTNGLRQGCPLSPYLFSIVMDGLSNLIEEAISNHSFNAISHGNSVISHLMYADDLLLFGKAITSNAHSLKTIFEVFGAVSGLLVNPLKSTVIFSKDSLQAAAFCDVLQIQKTTNPVTYLGLPIYHKMLRNSDFQPLIQNISGKLNGWYARTLSFAGRIQFLKYTICNTLAYWIRGAIIPKGCCKIINRICSRFLYFGNTELRKLHAISWNDTCLPKDCGGLGINSIDNLYHTFGCALIWRFLHSENLLFNWWRSKYCSFWKPASGKTSLFGNICVIWHKKLSIASLSQLGITATFRSFGTLGFKVLLL